MAANLRTAEMRVPTRAAPRPPINSNMQNNSPWSSNNDLFRDLLMPQPIKKKKIPPPRPPPPKFNQSHLQKQKDQKPKKPARPTELLTNLFNRKANKFEPTDVSYSQYISSNTSQSTTSSDGTVSLIDLSPPGSPTLTTRSSSDGVSVDSFGSDGNSNLSAFTSSGSTSQADSAFEDDFDFFGMSSKKAVQNDPWQVKPTQPKQLNVSSNVKQIGDTCFFAFNESNSESRMSFNQTTSNTLSMPTIIRAKPPKPPAPKILPKSLDPFVNVPKNQFNCKPDLKSTMPATKPVTLDLSLSWNSKSDDSPSPPMPMIPPPVPPPEYLTITDSPSEDASKKPYGIALYDFPATHPDDLPLKEGDVVALIKVINDDWMEGQVGERRGMFPANFVDIKIPLPGTSTNVVTALYSFKGEAPEDLPFNEGSKITVLSRISQDWLYGECNGRRGQFPANYVNRIPPDI